MTKHTYRNSYKGTHISRSSEKYCMAIQYLLVTDDNTATAAATIWSSQSNSRGPRPTMSHTQSGCGDKKDNLLRVPTKHRIAE